MLNLWKLAHKNNRGGDTPHGGLSCWVWSQHFILATFKYCICRFSIWQFCARADQILAFTSISSDTVAVLLLCSLWKACNFQLDSAHSFAIVSYNLYAATEWHGHSWQWEVLGKVIAWQCAMGIVSERSVGLDRDFSLCTDQVMLGLMRGRSCVTRPTWRTRCTRAPTCGERRPWRTTGRHSAVMMGPTRRPWTSTLSLQWMVMVLVMALEMGLWVSWISDEGNRTCFCWLCYWS